MTNFVKIGSGEPFEGTFPTSVELPIFIEKDQATDIRTYSQGQAGWDQALFRYMFLNGYCYPEDNEREMNNGR